MEAGNRLRGLLIGAMACALLPAATAGAQARSAAPGPEIVRGGTDLEAELRVVDRTFANTALVFSNAGKRTARVYCVATNANGVRVGSAWLKIPGNGLRFALATDFSNGQRFIGSARCKTQHRVIGSAIFVGPGLGTDLSVQQSLGVGSMFFPLVATY